MGWKENSPLSCDHRRYLPLTVSDRIDSSRPRLCKNAIGRFEREHAFAAKTTRFGVCTRLQLAMAFRIALLPLILSTRVRL